MKENVILIPSARMDQNKKKDRNESGLIRMSKTTRNRLGLTDSVELYNSSSTDERLKKSLLLDIFQAYSEDIARAKTVISEADMSRVGFVTTKVYNLLTNGDKTGKSSENIWVSDGPDDLVVGSDPEFVLFNTDGSIVRANNLLPYNGRIGCDGAMAELRPKPAVKPEELVSNIRDLLSSAPENIKGLTWKPGCYFSDNNRDYPVGGHIHIGNPRKIEKLSLDNRYRIFKALNKVLDEQLSIPMIKVDGSLGKARRSECKIGKYGWHGEFRDSNGHFEHRTLSGLWLSHPKLSESVIGVAQAISEEVFRRIFDKKIDLEYVLPSRFAGVDLWRSGFSEWGNIGITSDMGCVSPSNEVSSIINNSDVRKVTQKYLSDWYKKMKDMSTYKSHHMYIDNLYNILKSPIKSIHAAVNKHSIQESWLGNVEFMEETV